jgi:hypothetical protein
MNITELKSSLEYLFKAELTPFIWGHAGIGKSTAIKQYAEEKGYKFFPFYLGTQSDLGDILGLASFVKDENGSEIATQFATPLWLKQMIEFCEQNPESGAVIFLDEFNRARRDILNGMFSLALDKTFHTIKLPKNCHIVAAGNPPTDEYFTTDVEETALMARFVHIKLEPSFKEWSDYAKLKNFEPSLLGFYNEQPDLLEEKRQDFTLPVKVDRRSVERLDKLFKVGTPRELLYGMAAGIIGIERLVAYKAYLQREVGPLTPEQILDGTGKKQLKTWCNPKDVKSALINTTCDNLIEHLNKSKAEIKDLTEDQVDNFVTFIEYLPKDVAFSFLRKLMSTDNPLFLSIAKDDKSKANKRLLRLSEEINSR